MISCGGLIIALIGFIGSYSAVQYLAVDKGFGDFARLYPIGVDAGIVVLLALDLLLSWIRIPFPLLRQTAWLLTATTIAFNAAAAWPDPLGVAMHGVIPVLFVVTVEAARHAVGRIADITADRHMEGVRLSRWVLSPIPTFRLWRRMKLWELRSYDQAITLEQDRLIYEARLEVRYGPSWRRTAPIEALMPLRLAKFGVPVQAGDPAHLQPSSALELPPATAKSGRLAETPPLLPSNATPEDAPTPPAETDAAGRLGPGGQGIALHALAAWVPIDSGELQHLVDQLTAADWLVDAALTDAQLTGQLTERVLPLPCPLRA